MRHGDLSHNDVSISQETKLSEIDETEVWDKFHILSVVVGSAFHSIEKQFQLKQEVREQGKEPNHGILEFIHWLSTNQKTTNFLDVE